MNQVAVVITVNRNAIKLAIENFHLSHLIDVFGVSPHGIKAGLLKLVGDFHGDIGAGRGPARLDELDDGESNDYGNYPQRDYQLKSEETAGADFFEKGAHR